jgi:hypothetical protein
VSDPCDSKRSLILSSKTSAGFLLSAMKCFVSLLTNLSLLPAKKNHFTTNQKKIKNFNENEDILRVKPNFKHISFSCCSVFFCNPSSQSVFIAKSKKGWDIVPLSTKLLKFSHVFSSVDHRVSYAQLDLPFFFEFFFC